MEKDIKELRKRMSDEYDKMEAAELKEAKKHPSGDVDHRMAELYARQEDEFDDRLTKAIKKASQEIVAKRNKKA